MEYWRVTIIRIPAGFGKSLIYQFAPSVALKAAITVVQSLIGGCWVRDIFDEWKTPRTGVDVSSRCGVFNKATLKPTRSNLVFDYFVLSFQNALHETELNYQNGTGWSKPCNTHAPTVYISHGSVISLPCETLSQWFDQALRKRCVLLLLSTIKILICMAFLFLCWSCTTGVNI